MSQEIKRADWVECLKSPGPVGLVKRVARNGSWADVRWRVGGSDHVKRMRTSALKVVTKISGEIGGMKFEARDYTREQELAGGER